jgi:hypothetical protein
MGGQVTGDYMVITGYEVLQLVDVQNETHIEPSSDRHLEGREVLICPEGSLLKLHGNR